MAGYVEPRVTRDSVLQDYMRTMDAWQKSYETPGASVSSMSNFNRLSKLKELLAMGDFGEVQTDALNPFSAGGVAPTVSTDNRFAAGLSDAESRLRALLDNPDSVQQSAAYKFRVGQGQEALQRSLGAKGLLNSGNRLMELTKYGQDMGSQEYENQFGRIGNLLQGYSGSWLGDKNANTARFGAEATAWNQAQANADRNRLGYAQLAWDKQKGGGGVVGRSSGGMTVPPGTLGGIGGDTDLSKNPWFRQQDEKRGWEYDYSQVNTDGQKSLWNNKVTGQSVWRQGGRENDPRYKD